MLHQSTSEPTLFELLDKYLQRTPGLEQSDFDFPRRYVEATWEYLMNELRLVDEERDDGRRALLRKEWEYMKDSFSCLENEEAYEEKRRSSESKLTYKAFMGALMVNCYSDAPRFQGPHQFLRVRSRDLQNCS